jgi:membrane protease YdiL (CAAX protease family)
MKQFINSAVNNSWNRLPVLFRSIITGFFVSTLGVTVWAINLTFVPKPWFLISMLIPLWLFWKFFSGGLAIKRSSTTRALSFRSIKLSKNVWKWGLLAAILFVVIVQFSFLITFRLLDMPSGYASGYPIVETMPKWLAFSTIIISSVVAAICEETGFRGYMQVPLEKRFGMIPAIMIVSVVFTLIHLNRVWAAPVIPNIFFASLLLGLLAYKTGSLVPGIIAHSILDVFDYSFWWTNLLGKWEGTTIFKTGLNLHFIGSFAIFGMAIIGFFWAIRKINTSNPVLNSNGKIGVFRYSF